MHLQGESFLRSDIRPYVERERISSHWAALGVHLAFVAVEIGATLIFKPGPVALVEFSMCSVAGVVSSRTIIVI